MNWRRSRAARRPVIETIEFQVVGELRCNPLHLLLLGNDGACYAYDMVGGEMVPLEPDDSWAVDLVENPSLRTEAQVGGVVA